MAEKKSKMSLEEIAADLAGMGENHKIDQIMNSVMEAFVTHPGVKYKDARGVEHYKTKFNDDEKIALADSLFNALAYHANLRMYPTMDIETFNKLKGMKDTHGDYFVDKLVQQEFGVSRFELRQTFAKLKKITPELISSFTSQYIIEPHAKRVGNRILSKINEHGYKIDAVKDFINKHREKYHLSDEEYGIEDTDNQEQIYKVFAKVAEKHYSDYKKEDKK